MMDIINIIINKKTRQVILPKSVIGNDGENLQEKLVFSFNDQFVDGTARLELLKQGETASYVMLTKTNNTYELPIKSIITKSGRLNMQLVITEGTNDEEIPIFKSNSFYVIVNSSINAEIEEEEEYPQWIDVANTKLNQLDNIDIEAEQTQSGATITITKKDGTEESVELTNGIPGQDGANGITPTIGNNGNWYLGETDTGKPSRGIQGETGAPGSAGQDGISPIANITKSGNTATITITDKSGTTTATVSDGVNGVDGQPGRDGYVQYTAGNNITIENNVISATGGADFTINIDEHLVSSNALIISELNPGRYTLKSNNNNRTFRVKASANYEAATVILTDFSMYEPFVVVNSPFESGKMAFYFVADDNRKISRYIYSTSSSNGFSTINDNYPILKTYRTDSNSVASSNTFTGSNTFTRLPQSDVVPTNNNDLVNKKYVDDKIGDINTILATLTTPGGNS